MSSFEWILLGLLLFEFLLRCALEIHDARAFQRKPDSFALARILPIVNDIFPPESNFSKWNENDGAFVKAHEKAHAELHHEMVRKFFWASSLVCIALLLGAIGIPFHLNLLGLLFLFHLIFNFAKILFHFICFAQEYEADSVAAKRLQKGLSKRAIANLMASEFPRTRLFAYVYRTHPTARMRDAALNRSKAH